MWRLHGWVLINEPAALAIGHVIQIMECTEMTLQKMLCLLGCLLLSNFSFAHVSQSHALIKADSAVAALEKTTSVQVPAAPQAEEDEETDDE